MFQIKAQRGVGRYKMHKSSIVVLKYNYQVKYRAHRDAVLISNEHKSIDIIALND